MLRTRILTALLLLPLVLAAIFLLHPSDFTWVIGVVLLLGSWEFHRLADLRRPSAGILLCLVQGLVLYGLYLAWPAWTASPIPAFALACALWGFAFLQLWRFVPDREPTPAFRRVGVVNALVTITAGWAGIAWLHAEPAGSQWLFILLLVIWAADVGAYFSGRAIGGPKLAPRISPGKTWAGFWGGLVSAAVVAVFAAYLLPDRSGAAWQFALLGAVTAVVSVAGDLFISMHKRTVGLKDTGRLFPGHGGLLDRIDSLLAGAPFFVLLKLLLGL